MTAHSKRLRLGVVAGALALALVAAACGGDDGGSSSDTTAASGGSDTTAAAGGGSEDFSGKTVTFLGPEVGSEADGVTAGLAGFEAATGAKVEYTGTRDAETQVRTAAEAGGDALPDIFFAPQPGLVRDLVANITPLDDATMALVDQNFDPYFKELVTIDGKTYGVPVKGDVKSLVWYSPKTFADNGYEIPETWDELLALQDQMKADGIAPWCVGIESGEATGWTFTDWMEDIMLRSYGPEVYDQWVSNELKFTDPKVKDVAEQVGDIWFTDGNVLGGREAIASTGFATAGLPILDGECGMHRQANFYAAQFKDADPNVTFGADGDVNVFYLPTKSDEFGKVTLAGGVYAVAMNDKPETLAAIQYLASPEFANNRIKADKGGYLSPNKAHDTSLYSSELDRTLAEILVTANPVRFDASDLMPGAVGAGAFWKDGTNFVNGTETVDQFLENVQAAWPQS